MSVSKQTRLGTRVRFIGYSFGYTSPPARGEEGEVTYMPGFKPRTYLPGPGGGLLYVRWDSIGVVGVSPNDLEKVSGRGERDVIAPHLPSPRLGTSDEDYAAAALKRYREPGASQPRQWVKGQLLRNRWSDEDAEVLLRRYFDKPGLGEADEDEDRPWISMSYGKLPDRKAFLSRVRDTYPMELVKSDARAIEECLMMVERKFAGKHDPFEEFPARHGKYGYRFTPQGLYALIECIIDSDEEAAMDLVSSILQTLNIEWV